jgi:hypothetical protein
MRTIRENHKSLKEYNPNHNFVFAGSAMHGMDIINSEIGIMDLTVISKPTQ